MPSFLLTLRTGRLTLALAVLSAWPAQRVAGQPEGGENAVAQASVRVVRSLMTDMECERVRGSTLPPPLRNEENDECIVEGFAPGAVTVAVMQHWNEQMLSENGSGMRAAEAYLARRDSSAANDSLRASLSSLASRLRNVVADARQQRHRYRFLVGGGRSAATARSVRAAPGRYARPLATVVVTYYQ
jgi:hypothetical protein